MVRSPYVEFHLGTLDDNVLRLLARLGYGVVLTYVGFKATSDALPIFAKIFITRETTWRFRLIRKYTIVAVRPWNRFVLNKYAADERVDVITIDAPDKEALPSKAQARLMAERGKALEIVLNPILKYGEKGLVFLRDVLVKYTKIEDLRIIVSQGVSGIKDVRNPRDVRDLIEILTGLNAEPFLCENPYEVLSDAIFRRGVCIGDTL